MEGSADALLLRVYLSQSHRSGDGLTFDALVRAMLDAGLSGATAFLGAEGFGSRRKISSDAFVNATFDPPVLLELVDTEAKVRAFLPVLESMLDDGLVVVEPVAVKRFAGGKAVVEGA